MGSNLDKNVDIGPQRDASAVEQIHACLVQAEREGVNVRPFFVFLFVLTLLFCVFFLFKNLILLFRLDDDFIKDEGHSTKEWCG